MSTRAGGGGCIVLIGMPGAGKSTVGVLVARHLGLGFVDTDLLVQERAGRRLQEIVDAEGHLALRRLEEEAVLGLAARAAVVATGGSVVYSAPAVAHLRALGVLVHLEAPLEVIEARVGDRGSRGIANPPGQGLDEIYRERQPLYRRHADLAVPVGGLTHEEAARAVIAAVRAAAR